MTSIKCVGIDLKGLFCVSGKMLYSDDDRLSTLDSGLEEVSVRNVYFVHIWLLSKM